MDAKTFSSIVDTQVQKSVDLLLDKNGDYNPDTDKLANFRAAALLGRTNLREALGGMMIKHTISLYDMINSTHQYPEAVWEEKITDHINYLLLLRAVIEEDHAIIEPQAGLSSDSALTELRNKLSAPDTTPSTTSGPSTGTPTSGPSSTPPVSTPVKN